MRQIRIIFTSDIHGYFYPTDYLDRKRKPKGLLHIVQTFHKDGNTLILDGGDTLQGAPFSYYSQMKGRPDIAAELMNQAGYDAVTIGNHDFNYGYEYLQSFLNQLNAVCVCQNCINRETGDSAFPWRIFQLENGVCVGIVGAVTDFVNVWEKKENLSEIKISETYESIERAYHEVKDRVDITICLYHGGMECDTETGKILETSGENIGFKICSKLGFDLLLTGHQHMPINGRSICGTYVVQNACNADTYHEIKISLSDGIKISSKMIFASEIPMQDNILPFQNMEDEVQNWLDSVVGILPESLYPKEHLQMALEGSKLADFINQVQLEYTKAEISCTSLANKVPGLPQKVKVRDILLTYPFPNTLVVLEITGKILKAALERTAEYFSVKDGKIGISESFFKPKIEHYNFDFYRGVTYEVAYDKPKGQRISKIRINGIPIEENKKYHICMNNYRASGAGGYDMYKECRVVKQYGKDMFEILLEHISKMKNKQ